MPDESPRDARYEELLSCSRCGTCLPVCPSYDATMREPNSPRGRVQLLLSLAQGGIEESHGLEEAFSTCLDCRACETVCPNDVHPGQLSTAHRSEIPRAFGFRRRLTRFVLGPMLSHHAWGEIGAAVLRGAYQQTGLQRLFRASRLARRFPAIARVDRYLPPLPKKSVRATLPEIVPAQGPKRGTVGFFLGCVMNTVFADASIASIRSLSLLGYDVVIPRGVGCCGAPHMTLGETDLAQARARQNLRFFRDVEVIVADCAACSAEMKHYDKLLGTDEAAAFAARVRDFTEFVAPHVPALAVCTEPATYHAACHLAHAQHVGSAPEDLVRRLCADYRPLPESDRCCGSAGVYWAKYPQIADHALDRKLTRIRGTGAQLVVTSNPGCILQLMAGQSKEDAWRVTHVSSIVLEALESIRSSAADAEKRI